MSVRRIAAGAGALALALTMLTPVGRVEVFATPLTLSESVEGLQEAAPEQAAADAALNEASKASENAGEAKAATSSAPDEETSVESSVSERIEAPLTFSAVGFALPSTAQALFIRTSPDGEQWDEWFEVDFFDALDGPDANTPEASAEQDAARDVAGRSIKHTEPTWVGEAAYVQVEVIGADAEEVTATFIDSMGHSGGGVLRQFDTNIGAPAEASAGAEVGLISRARWGADESLGSSKVSIADEVHMGVVHHTAHAAPSVANSYSQAEAPGIMRAIYRYHTQSLGWSDIGYNVVVDRFGNVYEGRKGGFDKGVVGAHARGHNTGSFGVSVIGNFNEGVQASPAALNALTRVLGVKAAIHGIDPSGWTNKTPDGVWRPTIVGHQDVGQSTCPGSIQQHLPTIREGARQYAVRFPDVPASSPHRDPILRLADEGVTTGCRENEFCPTAGLNRAQASSFVVRALELTPIHGASFSDLDDDGAHTASINVLVENGWLIGKADGTFGPWDQMTRGQLATLLARSLGLELRTPLSDPYPDVPRDAVHAPGMAALKEVGIAGNCGGGKFCPGDVARRDSAASFVDMVRDVRGR